MARGIDYGGMMHRAMQGLIADVLQGVAESGLPGEHHFFITFDTRDEGVEMADWLRARYPEEMTIVIQHWFDNLTVTHEGFSVTLNFGNAPEPLYIPFDSLRTFVDPSVEFGLRFETQDGQDDPDSNEASEGEQAAPAPHPAAGERKGDGAEVVSLDKWRK